MKEQVDHLGLLFREIMRGAEGETIRRSSAPFLTDASGNTAYLPRGGGGVYKVPVGFDAFLTRISIDYQGSNATTPAPCDLRIVADQNSPASLVAIFTQVPAVYSVGKSDAPLFRGGQEVVVCLTGGPVTTQIYCTVQVVLTPRKQNAPDALTDGDS
jgi:hypothetical protein